MNNIELVGSIDYRVNVKINPLHLDFSRFTTPECEHCHTKHERLTTYIVRLEDGALIQVGKGCLDKILGNKPRHTDYNERDMFFELMMGGTNEKETRDFLYCLIQYCKKFGIDHVKSINLDDFYEKYDEYIMVKNKSKWDFSEVDKVVGYFKGVYANNEFMENLKNLVISYRFNNRYFNIIKYAYKVYSNAINYKGEYNSTKVDYTSTKIAQIDFIDTYTTEYGWRNYRKSYRYRVIDNQNNVFEFYTTKEDMNLKKGDEIQYKIKGTGENKRYGIINKINYVKKIAL